jgi:flagellar hook-associated protein 2
MAGNISNMLNSRMRLSGLASGLDTDSIIKQIMRVERMKVDKIKQDKALLEWKRDDYRSVINSIRSFRDEFLEVLKPQTNFRSPSAFAGYATKSSNEAIATVTAGAGAASTTHSLVVKSLATASRIEGAASITGAVASSNDITDFSLQGKQLNITLDGVTKTIALEDFADISDMQTKLKTKINAAFGPGKMDVLVNGNKLEFKALIAGSKFNLAEARNSFISSLGFTSGQQNFIAGKYITATDFSTFNGDIKVKFNGVEKTISLSGLTTTSTLTDVKNTLQAALDDGVNGFGAGKIAVSVDVSVDGSKLELLTRTGEEMVISSASTNNVLGKLGILSGVSTKATSSRDIDLTANEKGKTFVVNVNGIDTTVEIDSDYSDLGSMASYIQSQLIDVNVSISGNKLVFGSVSGQKIVLKQGPEDSLASMGFAYTNTSMGIAYTDNTSNNVVMNKGLDSIENHFATAVDFDSTANVQFTINNVSINLNKTFANATMSDVMNAVNASTAGVEMQYDSLNDKFTLTSKTTGVAETITLTDTDAVNGLFKALGISGEPVIAGTDAVFDLDGVTDMVRSQNEFGIDGVKYKLNSADPLTTVTINVNADPDAMVGKIKIFISKYNEMLDKINGELSEKRDRDYTPLTDEQREDMSEEDIKKWEEKARSGLLNNDSLLNNAVDKMRRALSDTVSGITTNLAKIGITTGSYEMKGKLVIDEPKLRTALKNNSDAVVQLFTQESQYTYTDGLDDSAKRKTRYEETGLAQRLHDIIQDNIRTTRDINGKKGTLIEKAGLPTDSSEFKNMMSDVISQKDTLIYNLLDRLVDKEDALYKKFTAMEKALSQMNSQSGWLAQQFGGGQ